MDCGEIGSFDLNERLIIKFNVVTGTRMVLKPKNLTNTPDRSKLANHLENINIASPGRSTRNVTNTPDRSKLANQLENINIASPGRSTRPRRAAAFGGSYQDWPPGLEKALRDPDHNKENIPPGSKSAPRPTASKARTSPRSKAGSRCSSRNENDDVRKSARKTTEKKRISFVDPPPASRSSHSHRKLFDDAPMPDESTTQATPRTRSKAIQQVTERTPVKPMRLKKDGDQYKIRTTPAAVQTKEASPSRSLRARPASGRASSVTRSSSATRTPATTRGAAQKVQHKLEFGDVSLDQSDSSSDSDSSDSDEEEFKTTGKPESESFDSDSDENNDDDGRYEPEAVKRSPPKRSRRSVKPPTVTPIRIKKGAAPNVYKISGSPRARGTFKKPKTLGELRDRLHTAEIPLRLPCRQEEYSRIETFFKSAIGPKGTSQAMYISGVPGTGKTATVNAVISDLLEKGEEFRHIEVNAMELIDPKQMYVSIYKGLTDDSKRISSKMAAKKLNSIFSMADRKRPPVILVIDELDMLLTKKQELIYELFNWTTNEEARVSVIAIANTLDLPERMFSYKIQSRLGPNRMIFQPYNFEEIEQIIADRIQGADDFIDQDAIGLAARKVANISGDLRKAFDILRRAVEMVMEAGERKLKMKHVLAAQREASNTILVDAVKNLPVHGLTLFRCAVALVEKKGCEEFLFCELFNEYRMCCRTLHEREPFHESIVNAMLREMYAVRLLIGAQATNPMRRRIRLPMAVVEANFALKAAMDADKSIV